MRSLPHLRRDPRWLVAAVALLSLGGRRMPHWESKPEPMNYGRVVLDELSTKAGVPSVTFDHWRHRAKFTCRLCHVDVGFAMTAGATKISAETNRRGFHCGACHDGKTLHEGKPVFASCSGARTLDDQGSCDRCHGGGDQVGRATDYAALAKRLPRRPSGEIDWQAAEAQEWIKPIDVLEGISIKRPALKMGKAIQLEAKGTWLGDIIFSHEKHAVWLGCEVCHPEIFPSTKQGSVKFKMADVSAGRYCGVCHVKVAFPTGECTRCHSTLVR